MLSFMFDAAKNLIVNVREEDMNAESLETTFNTGRNRLEEKFPNLFAGKNRDKSRQWRVATWNKHIREERRMAQFEHMYVYTYICVVCTSVSVCMVYEYVSAQYHI